MDNYEIPVKKRLNYEKTEKKLSLPKLKSQIVMLYENRKARKDIIHEYNLTPIKSINRNKKSLVDYILKLNSLKEKTIS